jgi:hypothetical protein
MAGSPPSLPTRNPEVVMNERVPCRNPGCQRTMLPTTAADTGGICMVCVREKERQEHEGYIQAHRRDVDRFAGVSDPVEILQRLHRRTPHDPLVNLLPPPRPQEDLYAQLDDHQVARMVTLAIDCLRRDEIDQAEDIARCLVCLRDGDVVGLIDAFVARERFYPAVIFRRAGGAVRDHLIARLGDDAANRHHLLKCLAWIGDAAVVDLFGRWRRRPPRWEGDLHVPPEDYAVEAGWELGPDGARRDLFRHRCHALVSRPAEGEAAVGVIEPAPGECAWCGRTLVYLLRLGAGELGPSPTTDDVVIPTCSVCTCYGPVYGRTDRCQPAWHPANTRPEYLPDDTSDWDDLAVGRLTPSAQRRLPYHAASWFIPTQFSQIGGHPTWIQHAEYPRCPDCRRRMLFAGQISVEDIDEFSEGIYHGFVCHACQSSATGYQQS